MHICINKLDIIGSNDGLSPVLQQAIIWTNASTYCQLDCCGISIKLPQFSFNKMHLKMLSVKWPQCVKEDKNLCILHSQFCGCWWPGNTRDQVIRGPVIDLVLSGYGGLNTKRVKWPILWILILRIISLRLNSFFCWTYYNLLSPGQNGSKITDIRLYAIVSVKVGWLQTFLNWSLFLEGAIVEKSA